MIFVFFKTKQFTSNWLLFFRELHEIFYILVCQITNKVDYPGHVFLKISEVVQGFFLYLIWKLAYCLEQFRGNVNFFEVRDIFIEGFCFNFYSFFANKFLENI